MSEMVLRILSCVIPRTMHLSHSPPRGFAYVRDGPPYIVMCYIIPRTMHLSRSPPRDFAYVRDGPPYIIMCYTTHNAPFTLSTKRFCICPRWSSVYCHVLYYTTHNAPFTLSTKRFCICPRWSSVYCHVLYYTTHNALSHSPPRGFAYVRDGPPYIVMCYTTHNAPFTLSTKRFCICLRWSSVYCNVLYYTCTMHQSAHISSTFFPLKYVVRVGFPYIMM